MSEKHEWRKREKSYYLPKAKPELVELPAFKFLTISGEGSPDDPLFTECIVALYSTAYAIKMSLKKLDQPPAGYCDYTVYPLQGVWDLNEKGRAEYSGTINKEDLVDKIMLRQPEFVTTEFFLEMLEFVRRKRPQPLLDNLQFETIDEGRCVQMLHVGKFADESETFKAMEAFAEAEGLTRESKVHREIYLSDFRKVAPEKLKTVLRFKVL